MAQKKYVSLSKLSTFLDNLKNMFVSNETMATFETTVENKADSEHTHEISDVTSLQPTLDEIDDTLAQKSSVQITTSNNSENVTEILSTLKIHKLTQEQYDEVLANDALEDNALYLTPDEEIDLSGYATVESLESKADANHTHDDRYYTETEIDGKIYAINTSIATSLNEAKSYSNTNLNTAKTYADNAAAQKSQVQIVIWEADD